LTLFKLSTQLTVIFGIASIVIGGGIVFDFGIVEVTVEVEGGDGRLQKLGAIIPDLGP